MLHFFKNGNLVADKISGDLRAVFPKQLLSQVFVLHDFGGVFLLSFGVDA